MRIIYGIILSLFFSFTVYASDLHDNIEEYKYFIYCETEDHELNTEGYMYVENEEGYYWLTSQGRVIALSKNSVKCDAVRYDLKDRQSNLRNLRDTRR